MTKEKVKKIFIADFSRSIRLFIKDYVLGEFDCIETDKGQDLLDFLAENPPGEGNEPPIRIIIMSLELTDMDGFELAKEIRDIYPADELPIILSTSNNKQDVIIQGMNAGINDYIVKPFTKELLLSKIHKLERKIPLKDRRMSENISQIPFFKGIPSSQVAYILNTCSITKTYDKGEVLCSQGEENYNMFILLDGQCDVLYNEMKVATVKSIDTIGEMGFMSEKARSASVIVSKPSKIVTLQKKPFDEFLNEERSISEIICRNIIHSLDSRLRKSNHLIDSLRALASENFFS